jgi:hypothetical protein
LFIFRPNVGASRSATKFDIYYKSEPTSAKIEAQLTDPSLQKPILIKMDIVRRGSYNEDECEYSIASSFDYSGNPDKLLSKSLTFSKTTTNASIRKRQYNIIFMIEHPATNLYAKTWTKLESNNVPTTIDVGIELKNTNRQLVQYSMVANQHMTPNLSTASIRFNTPATWWKIEARCNHRDQFTINLYQDDVEPIVETTIIVDASRRLLQIEMRDRKNQQVQLHASARLVDAYTAAVSVWHSDDKGQKQNDADIKVQLDSADLLKTKLFFRPNMDRDLKVMLIGYGNLQIFEAYFNKYYFFSQINAG